MNVFELNPYVRLTKWHTMSWTLTNRIILDYELLYCDGGSCTIRYDGRDFYVTKGDFLLICPGIEHTLYNVEAFVQPHIHFDPVYDSTSELVFINFKEKSKLSVPELKLMRQNIFKGKQSSPILTIKEPEEFKKLFFETLELSEKNPLRTRANMICMLDRIEKDNFPGTFEIIHHTYPVSLSVKNYLDENIHHAIKLDELENVFNYSRFYLSKQFSEEYGVSIIAYHRDKRMEMAKALLEHNSVSEVGEKLGFSSLYAFSRAFKLYYGVSPMHSSKEDS